MKQKSFTLQNFSKKNLEGFTLIELLLVIAIIGLLSSIILASFKGTREKARISKGLQFSQSLHHTLGAYSVGVWRFDEGSDATAFDSSGYGNHGTLGNGTCTPPGSGSCPSWTTGILGNALSFDGLDDYVNLPDFNVPDSHTVSFWIYLPPGDGGWDQILAVKGTNLDRAPGIWTESGYPLRLHWRYSPGNQGFWGVGPGGEGTDFLTNTWYYITGVKDGGIFSLYLNGSFVASTSVPSPMTSPESPYLRFGQTSYAPRKMILDEVRIYSQALSTAEIQKLYVEGLEKYKNLTKQ